MNGKTKCMNRDRKFLIKCYFNDEETINKSFGLFDYIRNLTPDQKEEYTITNTIVSPIRCFIDFKGGDLLVLYFNKFAFYTDDIDVIKDILNGRHPFININGKKTTIGKTTYNDINYNVINKYLIQIKQINNN